MLWLLFNSWDLNIKFSVNLQVLIVILNYSMSEKSENINSMLFSKENHHPDVYINFSVKHSSAVALHFHSISTCLIFSEILFQICEFSIIYPDWGTWFELKSK